MRMHIIEKMASNNQVSQVLHSKVPPFTLTLSRIVQKIVAEWIYPEIIAVA